MHNQIYTLGYNHIISNRLSNFVFTKLFAKALYVACFIMGLQLASGFSLQAQSKGTIKGKIADINTKSPLEFATATLYSLPDTILVKGVISDSSGDFSLSGLNAGKYCLKVSSLGYKSITIDSIFLVSGNSLVQMDEIWIDEEIKNLNEVTIEGERLKGKAEVDKIVYTITPKAASVAHSGLELLRQVPAVQVDFQNNVTLEGSSNMLILVDGKERDKDYLAQLNPSSIEKIEVMTNPSAKYDASVDGVINIILKRENLLGFSGRVEGEIPLGNLNTNSSANIDMGYGPVRVYASAQLHAEKYKVFNLVRRKTHVNTTENIYNTDGNGTASWSYLGLNYGLDYFIDKNNTLNFYANYRPNSGGKNDFNSVSQLYAGENMLSYNQSGTHNYNVNTSQYYSLFFKHLFSKASQEITLDLTYFNFNGETDNLYSEQYYLADKETLLGNRLERNELGNNKRDAYGLKLDYTHPVGDNLKLYIGYNGYLQWFNNDFHKIESTTTDNFKYNEIRNAFYGSASGAIKSFNWQVGMRYEYSLIDIDSKTTANYDCLLPNASVQRKFSKTQTLKLSYRRSIQRPGINDLNPFVNQIDSITISHGNPDLVPAYTNKAEMNYSMQLGSNFITPGIYYSYFNNNFQKISVLNNAITESFTENIGKGFEYGINFSGTVKITKKLQFNPYFAVFSKTLKELDKYGIEGADKISWRTNFTLIANITPKLLFFTYFQYNSPYIKMQQTVKREPIYVFGLEHNILKDNKGKITALIVNPFMRYYSFEHSITESTNYWQEQDLNVDIMPIINLKFSYSFSKGKEIKKLERKKEVETENKGSLF